MDFVELNNPNSGSNLNIGDAVKYYNTDAPFAMISRSFISDLGAPVHLPDGAEITKITFYVKDIGIGSMGLKFSYKDISTYGTVNTAIVSGNTGSLNGNGNFVYVPATTTIVDNSKYTYRIFIHITDDEFDYDATLTDIQQAVYGIVIEYQ